ncbi:hypothetical protein FH972_006030 [Carpinus fangiana]|uniref:Uncharacterized protein n=1 Tax=Carpinus fangiana TaxID=176857 RepID=A0A5N6QUK4_9ROSI|nr:hypothetical protein FH972_006030 [Carpinus fangiana]
MSARQDRLEEKLDKRFDQLLSYIKELQKGTEQREKSVSFDTLEANFGSTSKGGMYAGDGGGLQRLKIASFHIEDSQQQQIDCGEHACGDDCEVRGRRKWRLVLYWSGLVLFFIVFGTLKVDDDV